MSNGTNALAELERHGATPEAQAELVEKLREATGKTLVDEVRRLAALPRLDYERERKTVAERFDIRTSADRGDFTTSFVG